MIPRNPKNTRFMPISSSNLFSSNLVSMVEGRVPENWSDNGDDDKLEDKKDVLMKDMTARDVTTTAGTENIMVDGECSDKIVLTFSALFWHDLYLP